MKIAGTYAKGSRPRIRITGNYTGAPPTGYAGTDKVKLFYKLTDIYEQPNNTWDGTLMYIGPGDSHVLYPTVSTTGPEAAATYQQYLTGNATYYSCYLVTQLVVEGGNVSDFGNIGEMFVEFYMDEYEGTNT